MRLINSTRVRGSVIQFDFAHRIKGNKVIISTTAVNEDNAKKKAFASVSKEYKAIKAQSRELRTV